MTWRIFDGERPLADAPAPVTGDIGLFVTARNLAAGVVGWHAGMTVVWSSTWSGDEGFTPDLNTEEYPGKVVVRFKGSPGTTVPGTLVLSATIDGRVSAARLRCVVSEEAGSGDDAGVITWGPV